MVINTPVSQSLSHSFIQGWREIQTVQKSSRLGQSFHSVHFNALSTKIHSREEQKYLVLASHTVTVQLLFKGNSSSHDILSSQSP